MSHGRHGQDIGRSTRFACFKVKLNLFSHHKVKANKAFLAMVVNNKTPDPPGAVWHDHMIT